MKVVQRFVMEGGSVSCGMCEDDWIEPGNPCALLDTGVIVCATCADAVESGETVLVEPTDEERSAWPNRTKAYVEYLEKRLDESSEDLVLTAPSLESLKVNINRAYWFYQEG